MSTARTKQRRRLVDVLCCSGPARFAYQAALTTPVTSTTAATAWPGCDNTLSWCPTWRNGDLFYYNATHWVPLSVSTPIVTAAGSFQPSRCPSDLSAGCLRLLARGPGATASHVHDDRDTGRQLGDQSRRRLRGTSTYGVGGGPGGYNIPFTVAHTATRDVQLH